jgi:hypothetical protein
MSRFDTIYASGTSVVASKVGADDGDVVIGRYTETEAEILIEDIAHFIEDCSALPFDENNVVYIVK